MAHLDKNEMSQCEREKRIRLNETSSVINRDSKSPGETERGPSGPYGHYEPDGPTCGGQLMGQQSV